VAVFVEVSCELPIVLIRYNKYSKKIGKTKVQGINHEKCPLFEWKNDGLDVSATVLGWPERHPSLSCLEGLQSYCYIRQLLWTITYELFFYLAIANKASSNSSPLQANPSKTTIYP
jgi:hypothetical protein